ncbi:unnamed protein product [Sphagnum jensenii]|uniref:Uncharacterized protein n=1 Tax=Sphagnum jensenii TaxID=128206 RepID=A0ABP0VCE5_9BRYO
MMDRYLEETEQKDNGIKAIRQKLEYEFKWMGIQPVSFREFLTYQVPQQLLHATKRSTTSSLWPFEYTSSLNSEYAIRQDQYEALTANAKNLWTPLSSETLINSPVPIAKDFYQHFASMVPATQTANVSPIALYFATLRSLLCHDAHETLQRKLDVEHFPLHLTGGNVSITENRTVEMEDRDNGYYYLSGQENHRSCSFPVYRWSFVDAKLKLCSHTLYTEYAWDDLRLRVFSRNEAPSTVVNIETSSQALIARPGVVWLRGEDLWSHDVFDAAVKYCKLSVRESLITVSAPTSMWVSVLCDVRGQRYLEIGIGDQKLLNIDHANVEKLRILSIGKVWPRCMSEDYALSSHNRNRFVMTLQNLNIDFSVFFSYLSDRDVFMHSVEDAKKISDTPNQYQYQLFILILAIVKNVFTHVERVHRADRQSKRGHLSTTRMTTEISS